MVWLPLIGIVGAVVVAAVVKARAEVHTEQEERVYKEEQDLAKEERQAQRKAEELAAQRAYDEVKAEAERAYKEAREDVKEARGDAKAVAAEAHKEGHGEAAYLVPYYSQFIGQVLDWKLKALPKPVTLVLVKVTEKGLMFAGVPRVVLFHHVKKMEEVGAEFDEDEDEDEDE